MVLQPESTKYLMQYVIFPDLFPLQKNSEFDF